MFFSSGAGGTCLVYAFILFSVSTFQETSGAYPHNFPSSMTLTLYNYSNWAPYSTVYGVWVAYPKTENDILDAVNWARREKFRVRASGYQHSWIPNTVTPDDTPQSNDGTSPVILLKINRHLTKMAVISKRYGSSSFWAQPGIQLSDLSKRLERHNLGFANIPDIDEPTLGGALVIAGHGTSVARPGQKTTPGHTHGTMSNLIIAFTAVVFDRKSNSYILKKFQRSDPEAKYFLTSLGRTFLTNVTLRVGPLLHLRVKSQLDLSADQLFRRPSRKDDQRGPTIQELVDKSDGLLATVFPYTDTLWIKSYTIDPNRPQMSRFVDKPCNYPAENEDDTAVLRIIDKMRAGDEKEATNLGPALAKAVNNTLNNFNAWDLWGSAPNVHVFSEADILPWKLSGHAMLTTRNKVQEVSHKIYSHYLRVRDSMKRKGKYPFTGTLELRVTGLDHPEDCIVPGAESPAISPGSVNSLRREDYDIIVWVSLKYMVPTSGMYEAATRFESFKSGGSNLFDIVRPEWVKEWAYNEKGPWKVGEAPNIFESFSRGDVDYLKDQAKTLNRYDPFGVLSNSFLDSFFN